MTTLTSTWVQCPKSMSPTRPGRQSDPECLREHLQMIQRGSSHCSLRLVGSRLPPCKMSSLDMRPRRTSWRNRRLQRWCLSTCCRPTARQGATNRRRRPLHRTGWSCKRRLSGARTRLDSDSPLVRPTSCCHPISRQASLSRCCPSRRLQRYTTTMRRRRLKRTKRRYQGSVKTSSPMKTRSTFQRGSDSRPPIIRRLLNPRPCKACRTDRIRRIGDLSSNTDWLCWRAPRSNPSRFRTPLATRCYQSSSRRPCTNQLLSTTRRRASRRRDRRSLKVGSALASSSNRSRSR